MPTWAGSPLLLWQCQNLSPMTKHVLFPASYPSSSTQTLSPFYPPVQAHLSRCLGTAGYGNRCPSPHPQYSSILAMSHSLPGCCHMHRGPLCQSSTPGDHCPQRPACVCWACGVEVVGVALLAGQSWQVREAVRLRKCLGKHRALACCGLSPAPPCHRWRN